MVTRLFKIAVCLGGLLNTASHASAESIQYQLLNTKYSPLFYQYDDGSIGCGIHIQLIAQPSMPGDFVGVQASINITPTPTNINALFKMVAHTTKDNALEQMVVTSGALQLGGFDSRNFTQMQAEDENAYVAFAAADADIVDSLSVAPLAGGWLTFFAGGDSHAIPIEPMNDASTIDRFQQCSVTLAENELKRMQEQER